LFGDGMPGETAAPANGRVWNEDLMLLFIQDEQVAASVAQ
jgi:hypothetical protein